MKYRSKNRRQFRDEACVYCGDHGNTIDHIPPTFWRSRITDVPHFEVSACNSCNSALWHRPLFTLLERTQWIVQWLTTKTPVESVWTQDDLDKLGPSLRYNIVTGLDRDERLRSRLAFAANALANLLNQRGLTAKRRKTR